MSAETKGLSSSPYAGPTDYSSQLSDTFGTITPVAPADIARAQRVIAGHLGDPTETALVLNMLGIADRPEGDNQ